MKTHSVHLLILYYRHKDTLEKQRFNVCLFKIKQLLSFFFYHSPQAGAKARVRVNNWMTFQSISDSNVNARATTQILRELTESASYVIMSSQWLLSIYKYDNALKLIVETVYRPTLPPLQRALDLEHPGPRRRQEIWRERRERDHRQAHVYPVLGRDRTVGSEIVAV